MFQRTLDRNGRKLPFRSLTKRSTRGRQPKLTNRGRRFAIQTLEDGGMLTIHRQHAHAVTARFAHHDFTGHHQDFFRSNRDIFPGADRGESGLEARRSHNRDQDNVGPRQSRQLNQSLITSMNLGFGAERRLQLFGLFRSMDRNGLGLMLTSLFQEQLEIVSCRQADEADFFRQVLSDFQRAGANGAGAAQENDVLHGRVNTCRRYRYMIGALNNKLSSKSRMPPIPGKKLPESFTPASRLNKDSMRSPITAEMLRVTPSTT